MRTVGLNALFLDPGVSGGSETYLRALVPRLVELRPDVRFELVTTRRGARALAADGWRDLLEIIELPVDDDRPLPRTRAELATVPRLARRRSWDLVHTISNRGPAWCPVPSVVSVLDVIFFQHRTLGLASTYGMRAVVALAARRAAEVITISEAARADIAAVLGISPAKIIAIPLGVAAPGASDPGALADLALDGARVVVNVATMRPHKNQELLVRALEHLPGAVVVLAGHDEGYGAQVAAVAAQLGVADRVRMVGRVEDPALEALWERADCGAFPTRAEGFGLPVLEAMARGVPVACSDLPVLREVAGDAAVTFDPDDPAGTAAAIRAAIERREELARAGRERAARFTWEQTAAATLDVYERVCTSG